MNKTYLVLYREMSKTIKCVVVGDGMVGKTCLLTTFKGEPYSEKYVCTVCDNYTSTLTYKGQEFMIELWDTAGQEDYDRLRPLSYPKTNVFLLCFSFDREQTLKSIQDKWYPEVEHHNPSTPIILVGCKLDAKTDPKVINKLAAMGQKVVTETQIFIIHHHHNPSTPIILVGCKLDAKTDPKVLHKLAAMGQKVVTETQGSKVAKAIKAFAYTNCSSKTGTGIHEVFEKVVEASLITTVKPRPRCIIL